MANKDAALSCSEILYMDWECSMDRVHSILVAIEVLCDDIGNEERVEAIVHLSALAKDIVADQLEYTRKEEEKEAREERARKKKAANHAVAVENNRGHDEQTM